MIQLYDSFSPDGRRMYDSLAAAGIDCPAIAIQEDGFLPRNMQTPFRFFIDQADLADGIDIRKTGKPIYFNQVKVPDFWEISANNDKGEIFDKSHLRGNIYYAKNQKKRIVSIVDWMDEQGVVRSCDHYNQDGDLFARTLLNAKQEKVSKTWFSRGGREVITEHYVTGDLILNDRGKIYIFQSLTEFVVFFLLKSGCNLDRILINSLSYPYFVSNRLGMQGISGDDILFWQEPIGETIPGNMVGIVEGTSPRVKKILVQTRQAYDRIKQLAIRQEVFHSLGYIYPEGNKELDRKKILILTNSDRVKELEYLIQQLPEMEFFVGAVTEMSSKLLAMDRYRNVSLYPNIWEDQAEELLTSCGIYLDINYEGEILNAVSRAFLSNAVILGWEDTRHSDVYIPPENLYKTEQKEAMVQKIRRCTADAGYYAQIQKSQRVYAMAESVEKYRNYMI